MDNDYIDKVLSGDTEAFRYFLKTYKDMAFNIAVSIVKDDHYAEEIVQDAFMKAFNGLKAFNKTSKFKTWFYRIIVNESFQRIRKLKKDALILNFSELHEPCFIPGKEPLSERVEQTVHAMKLLPPNENLVLNLFYLEEFTLKEVGEITGWTVANTKVLLHRARKKLRLQLEHKKNV